MGLDWVGDFVHIHEVVGALNITNFVEFLAYGCRVNVILQNVISDARCWKQSSFPVNLRVYKCSQTWKRRNSSYRDKPVC